MPEDMIEIKKRPDTPRALTDSPDFPFGTRLHFDDEMIEDLGVESLAVGDIVRVSGFAVIDSKSEHTDLDGDGGKSLGIQMTFIKVDREESDRAKQLYGAGTHNSTHEERS